jgi:hypothetical protein
MRALLPLFTAAYATVAALFGVAAVTLAGLAAVQLWTVIVTLGDDDLMSRAASAIEAIGMIAVALMGFEMAQTVVEEEVVRRVHVSAPTRVRRYVSRFLVVVVVALAIESLVGVMKALHENPAGLPLAAMVSVGAAALLAAWGVFVRLNRAVEELEPEGVEEARREDVKVQ